VLNNHLGKRERGKGQRNPKMNIKLTAKKHLKSNKMQFVIQYVLSLAAISAALHPELVAQGATVMIDFIGILNHQQKVKILQFHLCQLRKCTLALVVSLPQKYKKPINSWNFSLQITPMIIFQVAGESNKIKRFSPT